MKRFLSTGFAFALLSCAFAACTMDFDQFQPGAGGGTGGISAGGSTSTTTTGGTGLGGTGGTATGGTSAGGTCPTECCSPADCPTPVDPCMEATCTGGMCGEAQIPGCGSEQCMDNKKNGGETDVDCGGPECGPCGDGLNCDVASDCQSGICTGQGGNKKCAAPTCSDAVENGDETDVDCGGSCPAACGPNQGCAVDSDCLGDECTGNVCVPNCADGVKNGAESDVDCGGGTCPPCALGQQCGDDDANCQSGNCAGGTCQKAELGMKCSAGAECLSGKCADGVCCNEACAGTCRACDLAGTVGSCINIPTGQDPADECAGADVCDGFGACKKAMGQACAAGSDCLLGLFCADGVCCDTPCIGICQACNVAGSAGTCSNVPAGTDPANECSGNTPNCDGMGMCAP